MKAKSLFLCIIIFISAFSSLCYSEVAKTESLLTPAQEIVQNINVGWNLGNTLDSHNNGYGGLSVEDTEKYWGNPLTTEKLFKDIKAAGFNAVRIPVTWQEHIQSDGKIDPLWMNRVKAVVDMSLNEGLYTIINIHHDNWVIPSYAQYENVKAKMNNIWSQVAVEFAEYDSKLIFEGLNEPRLIGMSEEWTGNSAAYEIVNKLNITFINCIRSSGGKNSERVLMIGTYCNGVSENMLSAMNVPSDNRIIVTVHAYTPYNFALNQYGTNYWSSKNTADTYEIDNTMELINKYFVSKGVPVIIGEFGAINKGNDSCRIDWAKYYKASAEKYGIKCFVWDDGGNFKLYDRYSGTWTDNELLKAIVS